MGKQEQLEKICENCDERIKPFVKRLVNDAMTWQEQLDWARGKLATIELNSKTKTQYTYFNRVARDAQQQYVNVVKLLLKASRDSDIGGDDEFDKFMAEFSSNEK